MSRLSAYRRFLPSLASALVFFLTLSAVVVAQSSNSAPSNPSDAKQAPEKSDETLKVNVNVVGVFFNVKDKHGMLIPNQT